MAVIPEHPWRVQGYDYDGTSSNLDKSLHCNLVTADAPGNKTTLTFSSYTTDSTINDIPVFTVDNTGGTIHTVTDGNNVTHGIRVFYVGDFFDNKRCLFGEYRRVDPGGVQVLRASFVALKKA